MATAATLRTRVNEHTGDVIAFTTTSAGNAGGTTVVSTALQDEDFGNDDEGFASFWLLLTSGSNSGDLRRVARSSGYTASTGTLTVTRAFSAQIANSVTAELHRYDPRIKDNAINQAVRHLYPLLSLSIVDESLVVDDRLSNSDFETFASSAFTSWSTSGTPTLTQDTTTVKHGSSSAKLVGSGAQGVLYQAPSIDLTELAGKTVEFAAWINTSSANVLVAIDFGGAATQSESAAHTADGSWRQISVSATVPTDATKVECRCLVADGSTAYFDAAYLLAGPIAEYTIPSTMLKGPYLVLLQKDPARPEGPYRPIGGTVLSGRRLQLHGVGVHPALTSDTDTLAIHAFQEQMVSLLAAGFVFETIAASSGLEEVDRLREQGTFFRDAAQARSNDPKNQSPARGAEAVRASKSPWYWREDGTTRTLVFPRIRSQPAHEVF